MISLSRPSPFLLLYSILAETVRHVKVAGRSRADLDGAKVSWGKRILSLAGVQYNAIGTPSQEPGTLFVGNHISYLDIPLLMATTPGVAFVAKGELGRWPVFGAAAKKIGTVFVERSNRSSRHQARTAIRDRLKAGDRIAMFPSGTTCIPQYSPWRRGAFEVAQETGVWLQPFRISYQPLSQVAYLDDDIFLIHLFGLFRLPSVQVSIEFHEPVKVTDCEQDCLKWSRWAESPEPFASEAKHLSFIGAFP